MIRLSFIALALVCLALFCSPHTGSAASGDIVLRAAEASVIHGTWSRVPDVSAAGGSRLASANQGQPKPPEPSSNPANYFELTFAADAGIPYHLWLRGRAESDSYDNDSVWLQFSDSVMADGTPTWRIGSNSATSVVLEDCAGCGLSGWGWQDNGYNSVGVHVRFASSGTHTLRVQVREDGLSIDQLVLSAGTYLETSPGTLKNDSTILGGGSGPSPATLIRGPYLQQLSDHGVTIVWATREAGSAMAQVGAQTYPAATTYRPAATTGLPTDEYHHEAAVSGLLPSSEYSYRLLLNGTPLTDGSDVVTTAPATGSGSVRFVIFGDSGTGSPQQAALASRLSADTFDLALHGGDIAYGNSGGTGDASYATYQAWFFDMYRNWLRRRPMFPSMGNHDARASNNWGQAYLELFSLPTNGGTGAYPDHAERYYSFDYGPIHFIALDTELAFQDVNRRQAQLTWLREDLAATAQPWKVAYFHRSPFSAGGEHGSDLLVREAFAPIFEEHGVQLSLSAHEHTYERSVPWRTNTASATARPVTYIVSGGGGGPLYGSGSDVWTAYSASAHHYLRVTISGCLATTEAVAPNGAVFDSSVVDRCSATTDTTPPSVSFIGPAGGSAVTGVTTIEIAATDDVGVAQVELLIDGQVFASDATPPYLFSWDTAAASAGTHVLEARAYDAAGGVGSATRSVIVDANGGSDSPLPPLWQSLDVGAVGISGSANFANGTFSVSAAGADIWGVSDAFRYVYRTLDGDGEIVARVSSVAGVHPWTKVGVMIRAAIDPAAAHAAMFVSAGKGLAFQRRPSTATSSAHTAGAFVGAPQWVRLVREGARVIASASPDGLSWSTVGEDTIQLPQTALIGLAVTAHDASALATGTFNEVSVREHVPAVADWSSTDVGAVGVTGSAALTAGAWTIAGAGADVWGTADAFHFVWRPLPAGGSIVARVASLSGAHPWTKAGVMIRGTLDPGSPHAFMLASTAKGLAFQRRTTAGGLSEHTGTSGAAPQWLKLERHGLTITASFSIDGQTWTVVGSDTFAIGGPALVGLAVTSHDATQAATASFDSVGISAEP